MNLSHFASWVRSLALSHSLIEATLNRLLVKLSLGLQSFIKLQQNCFKRKGSQHKDTVVKLLFQLFTDVGRIRQKSPSGPASVNY